jgi:hypothetical protein
MCDESKAGLRNVEQGLLLAAESGDAILETAAQGGLTALQWLSEAFAIIDRRQGGRHGS